MMITIEKRQAATLARMVALPVVWAQSGTLQDLGGALTATPSPTVMYIAREKLKRCDS